MAFVPYVSIIQKLQEYLCERSCVLLFYSTLDIDTLGPHFDSITEQINQNFMIEKKKKKKQKSNK